MPEFYVVFLREMLTFRRRIVRYLIAGIINPLLFLTAFGLGLGRSIKMQGIDYLDFVLPGIAAMSAMFNSFYAVGVSLNISKRYTKTLEEYLVAPISTFSLVLGKVLAGVFRGIITSFLIILIGLLYGAHISLSILSILTIALTCFLFASLGAYVGIALKSHEDMNNFNSIFLLPMAFLSGTFFSVENAGVFKYFLYMLPLTHASTCLRASMLNMEFPYISLLILLIFSCIFFISAIRVFKKGDLT